MSGVVRFLYTNYKGISETRRVKPISIDFKATEHHPKQQWILTGWDMVREAMRDYAMNDISEWRPDAED